MMCCNNLDQLNAVLCRKPETQVSGGQSVCKILARCTINSQIMMADEPLKDATASCMISGECALGK
jgi:ABC-type thiamine transport system ATPase subunit